MLSAQIDEVPTEYVNNIKLVSSREIRLTEKSLLTERK